MRDRGQDRISLHRLQDLAVLHRGIEVLRHQGRPEADEEAAERTEAEKERRLRENRLLGKAGRVQHAEPLALPALLEAPRHLGLELLAEERGVVLVELLVVAGEVGQLLLGARRLLDAGPDLGDLALQVLPALLEAARLDAGPLQLFAGHGQAGIGDALRGRAFGRARLRQPRLQPVDTRAQALDVGMGVFVARPQRRELPLEVRELASAGGSRHLAHADRRRTAHAASHGLLLLPGEEQALLHRLHLPLQHLHGGQVGVELLRQPSHVLFLVPAQGGVLVLQLRARVLHLSDQEVDRALHLLGPRLDRLVDEEARQPVRDLLRLERIAMVELDLEAVVAADVDEDGVAHLLHALVLAELRVGPGLVEDPLQPRAAEDLRPHRLQPLAGITGGDLRDEGLRHLLRLHQHERRGHVLLRQHEEGGNGEEEDPRPRQEHEQGPSHGSVQEVAELRPLEAVVRPVGLAAASGDPEVAVVVAHGTTTVSPAASTMFCDASLPSATRL
jgi:hypothetical protein